MRITLAPYTIGLVAVVSKRKVPTMRDTASDPRIPRAHPAAAILMPEPSTSRAMLPRCAPRATRTAISCVRCEALKAITA